jgi:serine protease Do
MSFERIQRVGWQAERARALAEKRLGILLTAVIPGSPAALARLRPGDVILRVNNDDVQNAEDFTWLLDGAGPGNSLKFTVARPEKLVSEAMEIKLSESPNLFGPRGFGGRTWKEAAPGSLLGQGIETIALKPAAAVHFGSTGGLFVVSVEPSTAASKAGLQSGDVIESIDGQPVLSGTAALKPKPAGAASTCVVVRNKEKIVLTIQYSPNRYTRKPQP